MLLGSRLGQAQGLLEGAQGHRRPASAALARGGEGALPALPPPPAAPPALDSAPLARVPRRMQPPPRAAGGPLPACRRPRDGCARTQGQASAGGAVHCCTTLLASRGGGWGGPGGGGDPLGSGQTLPRDARAPAASQAHPARSKLIRAGGTHPTHAPLPWLHPAPLPATLPMCPCRSERSKGMRRCRARPPLPPPSRSRPASAWRLGRHSRWWAACRS